MSSKAVGQHQQGRRTPLSLTGGKHAQQHKNNSNSNKNQEIKSETNAAKNGNNNPTKNQETINQTQKEFKKTQQNGNTEQQNPKKSIDKIDEEVIIVEQNGKSNGHNNKNNIDAAKNSETNNEVVAKEKPQKNETNKQVAAAAASGEKKQIENVEKPTAQVAPNTTNNSPKPKDVTPATTPTVTSQTNEKKQTPISSAKAENNQKSGTPTKAINEKSAATPPTKTTASKQSTPSKSPRNQKKNTPENSKIFDEQKAQVFVDNSPIQSKKASTDIEPTATSTPGKMIMSKRNSKAKTEIQLSQEENCTIDPKTIPRSFSQISGRRTIRPLEDFTPSMYNTQFRESYRRINTELDVTGNTNTSMNVTVGSEIPNNSSFLSFSLFGRGRKRERTPPSLTAAKSQSAVELSTETTPPKRARLDVHGIFTAMSSPLTLLRSRFSKTTLESSTPAKGKETNMDDDVQNVSGVSIEEVVSNNSKGGGDNENNTELTTTEDNITVGKEATASTKSTPIKEQKNKEDIEKSKIIDDAAAMDIDSDIKITETPIIPAVGDASGKRGCSIM